MSTSLLTTEERINSDQLCSLCNSAGNFACINHCKAVLCAGCTGKHRAIIIKQMNELQERLKKICQINSCDDSSVLDTSATEVSDNVQQNVVNATNSSLTLTARKSLQVYLNILNEYLKNNRLLDAKTLADLNTRLEHRIDLVTRISRSLPVSHNLDTNKRLLRRSPMRAQSANVISSRTLTVSLNLQKHFPLHVQASFSLGKDPIIVSLNEHYLETFFCEWRDNSVILLSSLSIDVYARGPGLICSIPLSRVFGNVQDKIVAGVWCSYIQRLILVGRHHFYIFDMNRQKLRCVGECTCGARCGSGPVPPIARRGITSKFRSPSAYEDRINSQRFLVCSDNGYLFYAYKSGIDKYRLEMYALTFLVDDLNQEHKKQWSAYDPYRKLNDKAMTPNSVLSIKGQLAAIAVTSNRLAFIYRRFRRIEKSTTTLKNSLETNHYFALLDHNLTKLNDDVLLTSSIRWVTAIVPRERESEYLVCDPLGQQLLLYQAIDGVLIRRFDIGPVNACCLTDGRLALWMQKAYPTSPIGKLHFISASHLENYAVVAKSFELLNESHNQLRVWVDESV